MCTSSSAFETKSPVGQPADPEPIEAQDYLVGRSAHRRQLDPIPRSQVGDPTEGVPSNALDPEGSSLEVDDEVRATPNDCYTPGPGESRAETLACTIDRELVETTTNRGVRETEE